MSRILEPYPNIEEAVMDLLIAWYPELATPVDDPGAFRVGQVFPPELHQRLPFVRVRDIGGNDDGLTDTPLIDIDVFHSRYSLARDMARGIQARILSYPHRVGSTVIDKARTAMRPRDVPWDDERVYRFYGSYQISARR